MTRLQLGSAAGQAAKAFPPLPMLADEQKWTVACSNLRETLGIPQGADEPAVTGEVSAEEWGGWAAKFTNLVALDTLVKAAGVPNRFEGKKIKIMRLIRWAVE